MGGGVLFNLSAYHAVPGITSLISLHLFFFLAWASILFILFICIYADVAVPPETYAPFPHSTHCLLQGLDP